MKVFYHLIFIVLSCFLLLSCEVSDDSGAMSPGDYRSDGAYLSDGASGGSIEGANGGLPGTGGEDIPNSGVITAGEWSDLVNFIYWKELIEKEEWSNYIGRWQMFPKIRYSVLVRDNVGKPVIDASVSLEENSGKAIWESRTDNTGTAELWLNLLGNNSQLGKVAVRYNGATYYAGTMQDFEQGVMNINISDKRVVSDNIDIMFVVDATGSMGDEIEYLKVELYDVISRIKNSNSNKKVRLGSVFYRDHGDEYLTRVFPFTENYNQAIANIKGQSAEGGGDFPEAVDYALEATIAQQQWSSNAVARLCFLILDAPPHDKPDVIDRLKKNIYKASKLGIKIIPVTASGIDKETEFLMRTFALATNGTYVFITNHSGIGDDHLEPTIGEYEVEYLNNLLVRLANQYTAVD